MSHRLCTNKIFTMLRFLKLSLDEKDRKQGRSGDKTTIPFWKSDIVLINLYFMVANNFQE